LTPAFLVVGAIVIALDAAGNAFESSTDVVEALVRQRLLCPLTTIPLRFRGARL
jgi:hypothetical protein